MSCKEKRDERTSCPVER
ncbi:hypothetical protein TRICHSKD4_1495, partial [Roseibium sp. TrichSKD4]